MQLQVVCLLQADQAWAYCRHIRTQVFIVEQAVPDALEWDAEDASAQHLLAMMGQAPVGCASVLPNGYIGRMAVLPAWRGRGVGAALLKQAVAMCRVSGQRQARLSAQTHAIDFYARAGFVVISTPYLDANIPHVDMMLELL